MLAELRTISLCDSDSDLFMQTYNVIHRKSSDSSHSAAVSYYSGTESQQSVSDRSFYDNIAVDDVFEHHHHTHHSHNINNNNNNSNHHYTKARNYLMPPINNLPLRLLKNPHINVNRSVSFQGTCGQSRTYLTPRQNIIVRRRNDENILFTDTPSDFGSTRSSISPSGSNVCSRNNACDCSSIIPKTNVQNDRNLMDESYCYKYHYDKKYDGPFYLKMLRRMQKIFKRQSKKSERGRSRS